MFEELIKVLFWSGVAGLIYFFARAIDFLDRRAVRREYGVEGVNWAWEYYYYWNDVEWLGSGWYRESRNVVFGKYLTEEEIEEKQSQGFYLKRYPMGIFKRRRIISSPT